jgi:hypothetical protein
MTGYYPIEILALVDITKKAAGVFRIFTLLPEAATVSKADIGVFFCHFDDGVEIAE